MNLFMGSELIFMKPRLIKSFRTERKYEIFQSRPSAPCGKANFSHRELPHRAETCFFSGARFRSGRKGNFFSKHASARCGSVNLKKGGLRMERREEKTAEARGGGSAGGILVLKIFLNHLLQFLETFYKFSIKFQLIHRVQYINESILYLNLKAQTVCFLLCQGV